MTLRVAKHNEGHPRHQLKEMFEFLPQSRVFGTIGMYSPILVSSFTMATV